MATLAPTDLGQSAVAQTSGLSSPLSQFLLNGQAPAGFIPTLRGMTPQQSVQAVMSPYGPAGFSQPFLNPGTAQSMGAEGGGPTPTAPSYGDVQAPSAYLTALAHAANGGAAPAAPTLTAGNYLDAITGPAPSASDFGPAPSLSDFFTSTPYDQALAAVASGNKTAQSAIGSNYNAANDAMAQIAALTSQNTANQSAQMKAAEQNATNAVNGYAQNAEQLAGPGGGVAARMAGLQGTLAGQQGAQNALAAVLQGVQNFNAQQDKAALTTNKQGALDSLAAAVNGTDNKISLAEAADQAKAQQMLASANNARGVAMAKASSDYQKARSTALTQAYNLMKANGTTGNTYRDNALQQMTDWANSGDPNGAALSGTASQILSGSLPNGAPIMVNGKAAGEAKSYADALSRLNASAVPKNSPEYQLLAGVLGNYFSSGKSASSGMSLTDALAQMAQAYGG